MNAVVLAIVPLGTASFTVARDTSCIGILGARLVQARINKALDTVGVRTEYSADTGVVAGTITLLPFLTAIHKAVTSFLILVWNFALNTSVATAIGTAEFVVITVIVSSAIFNANAK